MGWGMEGPDGWEDGRRLNLESIPKGEMRGRRTRRILREKGEKRCVCVSSKLFLLAGIVFGKSCVRAEEVDAQVT